MERKIVEKILNDELHKFKKFTGPLRGRYQSGRLRPKKGGFLCWKVEIWEE